MKNWIVSIIADNEKILIFSSSLFHFHDLYSLLKEIDSGPETAFDKMKKEGVMNNILNGKTRRFKGALAVPLFFMAAFLLIGFIPASGLSAVKKDAHRQGIVSEEYEPLPSGMSLAPLAEKLKPSVVNIKVTKVHKVGMAIPRLPKGSPFENFFDQFYPPGYRQPREREVKSAGSGVIISNDGYILTNNHVVEGAKKVLVTLDDQKEYEAEIIGLDPKTDLAVLKVENSDDLPAATMGDSEKLRVGDHVLAIGNPFGLSHTVTSGIVSAKDRVIGAGPYDDFIQTDASINPGNSGGPLFNMKGEVVGINTAIIPYGQGIGFSIPINTAKALIPQLVENGEVTRGYIGIYFQEITGDLAKALGLDDKNGALVADIVSGGPADEGGVERGDVIVSFNGKKVKKSHDLPSIVAETPVGEKATVTVIRDGKERKLKVRVGKLESKQKIASRPANKDNEKWGLMLQDLTPRIADRLGVDAEKGAVVSGVSPGSPAERAQLRRGDVILEVDQKPVESAEDVEEAVEGKDSVLLLVQRKDIKQFVPLTG
jgi:serine protease Do